ncbi:MAG TPA: hypothetical protein G4O02_16835 [Caldilineae bacterium]|nr:hypothetical protein [Caldilineae bacterium]
MERSSSGLRTIATVFKVLAWVLLAVGIIATIVLYGVIGRFVAYAPPALASAGRFVAFLPIITGILYFLFFFITSNVIALLLQIEENVRTAAEHLSRQ